MSNFVEINGSPDELRVTGTLMGARAAELKAKAEAILDRISDLEDTQPWGADHFGKNFLAGYHQVPKGGDRAFNTVLAGELSQAGQGLARIGDAVGASMTDYQVADGQNAADIATTGPV
jgi:hypothetical protein